MREVESIETEKCSLEIVECDCGFHLGIDASYLDQVGGVEIKCPSCNTKINVVGAKPTKCCDECFFMHVYSGGKNILKICESENIEVDEEGLMQMPEVSNFNATDCLNFRKVKKIELATFAKSGRLSFRALNSIEKNKIRYVHEIAKLTKEELMAIRYVGRKAYWQLKEIVAECGLQTSL